jgi:hypothetical protein
MNIQIIPTLTNREFNRMTQLFNSQCLNNHHNNKKVSLNIPHHKKKINHQIFLILKLLINKNQELQGKKLSSVYCLIILLKKHNLENKKLPFIFLTLIKEWAFKKINWINIFSIKQLLQLNNSFPMWLKVIVDLFLIFSQYKSHNNHFN